MASCNAVLKSESKSKLRQVSNSAQTQHFSSLELLLDSYMPEMALSSKCSGQISGWISGGAVVKEVGRVSGSK